MMVKEIVKEMREMPVEDLKTVKGFVSYLREKEVEEDILSGKKFISAVKKSQKAWREKKTGAFIGWDALKKKYKL